MILLESKIFFSTFMKYGCTLESDKYLWIGKKLREELSRNLFFMCGNIGMHGFERVKDINKIIILMGHHLWSTCVTMLSDTLNPWVWNVILILTTHRLDSPYCQIIVIHKKKKTFHLIEYSIYHKIMMICFLYIRTSSSYFYGIEMQNVKWLFFI